jgi:GNAT superfamily N-acetyltransferase
MIEIRQLKENQIAQYITVLHERYYWLKDHNLDMWDLEKLLKESLVERYKSPVFYAGFENNVCVGGFILIDKDEKYWPNNLNDDAFYFHKFVVSPRYSRKGYSGVMLEWVKEYGKEKGKDFIRLDYEKRRTYLRNMYLKHGFIDVNEMTTNEGHLLILAECELG